MTFVGVCGGRDFRDERLLAKVLSELVTGHDVIVTGAARGADNLARGWALKNSIHIVDVPALWSFGRSAGLRRNAVIAALPLRLLIAFPGGVGTADMVRKARAAGIEVLEVPAP